MTALFFTPSAADAITAVERAATVYGEAKALEMRLEDERALVKRDAISRLIATGAASSATAAEKVVEQDELYNAHRIAQRHAVVDAITKQGMYEAAKLRARLAVGDR